MVEPQSSKLITRVRFPSSAPLLSPIFSRHSKHFTTVVDCAHSCKFSAFLPLFPPLNIHQNIHLHLRYQPLKKQGRQQEKVHTNDNEIYTTTRKRNRHPLARRQRQMAFTPSHRNKPTNRQTPLHNRRSTNQSPSSRKTQQKNRKTPSRRHPRLRNHTNPQSIHTALDQQHTRTHQTTRPHRIPVRNQPTQQPTRTTPPQPNHTKPHRIHSQHPQRKPQQQNNPQLLHPHTPNPHPSRPRKTHPHQPSTPNATTTLHHQRNHHPPTRTTSTSPHHTPNRNIQTKHRARKSKPRRKRHVEPHVASRLRNRNASSRTVRTHTKRTHHQRRRARHRSTPPTPTPRIKHHNPQLAPSHPHHRQLLPPATKNQTRQTLHPHQHTTMDRTQPTNPTKPHRAEPAHIHTQRTTTQQPKRKTPLATNTPGCRTALHNNASSTPLLQHPTRTNRSQRRRTNQHDGPRKNHNNRRLHTLDTSRARTTSRPSTPSRHTIRGKTEEERIWLFHSRM